MGVPVRFRLSMMMALIYAVQGSFWPLLAVHLKDLGVPGRERGWIFATLAIGSIAMPLGAGQLVDRKLAGQRLLALIFALSTAVLMAIAACGWVAPVTLFALFLLFWLITAPAFALGNAIAMRHLPRPYEQFSGVRLWGTVGWMAIGWLVTPLRSHGTGTTSGGQASGAYRLPSGSPCVGLWRSGDVSAGRPTLPDTFAFLWRSQERPTAASATRFP